MDASNANGQSPFIRGNSRQGRDSALPEGSFLSPADSAGVLASLEEKDGRTLGLERGIPFGDSLEDEGVFISPEEAPTEEPSVAGDATRLPLGPGAAAGRETGGSFPSGPVASAFPPAGAAPAFSGSSPSAARDGELLSRIAGELRSIKSELADLKDHYRDVLADSSVFGETAETVPRPAEKEPDPPPKGQVIPEEMFAETRALLGYLDGLLESLPDAKIEEFARSEYYDLYRKVYEFFNPV